MSNENETTPLSNATDTTLPPALLTKPAREHSLSHILPVYIITGVFGGIFILFPLLVRRGPNAALTRTCIMLSAFCCWIFWVTTYIVQMNPLLTPRLSNTTLAWIGHKWGKDPKSLASTDPNKTEKLMNEEPTNKSGGTNATDNTDASGNTNDNNEKEPPPNESLPQTADENPPPENRRLSSDLMNEEDEGRK